MIGLDKDILAAMPPARRAATIALNRAISAAVNRMERQYRTLDRTIARRRAKIRRDYDIAIMEARAAYRQAEDEAHYSS